MNALIDGAELSMSMLGSTWASGQSYPVHALAHPPRLDRPVHPATGGHHSPIPEADQDNDVRGGGTY